MPTIRVWNDESLWFKAEGAYLGSGVRRETGHLPG
jgi:hypothetical protein